MATAHWCRIAGLGRLEGDKIALYEGELFADPVADGTVWSTPQMPDGCLATAPVPGLWNNFHERQQLEQTRIPDFHCFSSSWESRCRPFETDPPS